MKAYMPHLLLILFRAGHFLKTMTLAAWCPHVFGRLTLMAFYRSSPGPTSAHSVII